MLRALCLIIAVFALPATAQESLRPQPLANALQAAANKDWQTARDLAIRAGAGAPELIEWQRMKEPLPIGIDWRTTLRKRSSRLVNYAYLTDLVPLDADIERKPGIAGDDEGSP